jgi:hypothetical protein
MQDGGAKRPKSQSKKRKSPNMLTTDAFSKLFDKLSAEAMSALQASRLGSSAMPAPTDMTRSSWQARADSKNNPVLVTMRDLGAAAADLNNFVDALFKNGLPARRVVEGEDDPEHALDGQGVLALTLACFLGFHSDCVMRLSKTLPCLDADNVAGLWQCIEVLSVPAGENLPPMQDAVNRVIRARPADENTAVSTEMTRALGDLCYCLCEEFGKRSPVAVKDEIIHLVFYLDGLAATMIDDPPRVKVDEVPVAPPPPAINLMDMLPSEEAHIHTLITPEVEQATPPPSWTTPFVEFEKTPSVEFKESPFVCFEKDLDKEAEEDPEDSFGSRLKKAFEATNEKIKWRT